MNYAFEREIFDKGQKKFFVIKLITICEGYEFSKMWSNKMTFKRIYFSEKYKFLYLIYFVIYNSIY